MTKLSVLVRNEKTDPYRFEAGRNQKTISPNMVVLISDEEWDTIAFSQRGPGKLNPLWPTDTTSDSMMQMLDYYQVGPTYEVHYLGFAPQGSLTSDPAWTIKKFRHTTLSSTNFIDQIQVLNSVIWDNRAGLPWA